MKLTLILFAGLISIVANAQNVIKTSDGFATVNQPNNSYEVGDKVQFLDSKLDSIAKGSVTKLSEGQGMVLIKIEEGKVRVGQTVEKIKTFSEPAKSSVEKQEHSVGDTQKSVDLSTLTPEERRIYENGEISTTRYIIGGALGSYPGFGIGHAVQGRYSDKGWIFTATELGALTVIAVGANDCFTNSLTFDRDRNNCDSSLITIGLASYIGLRIWEIIDVWVAPPEQNRRYRQLRDRMGAGKSTVSMFPVFRPVDRGAVLGLGASF